jgi:hypothetical protein
MLEQEKRKAGKSRLGRARMGKRGVWCGQCHTEAGGEWGPASHQLCGSGGDGRRSGGVRRRAGPGEQMARVGYVRARGLAGERKELGRARENNADFYLKHISKLNMI